jgi:hypothetical protein
MKNLLERQRLGWRADFAELELHTLVRLYDATVRSWEVS